MSVADLTNSGNDRLYVKAVAAETEDSLAGTWVFNDELDSAILVGSFTVNFISNGTNYSAINGQVSGMDYDQTTVYYDGGPEGFVWVDQVYKTIVITSKLSEVTDGETFLNILKANATKQSAAQTLTTTANGGRLYVKTMKGNFLTTSDGAILQDADGDYLEFTGEEDTPTTNGGRLYVKTMKGNFLVTSDGVIL